MKSPWLMQGDCLERMKEIPDGSVDLTVTSPPYDNLRTYNGNISQWTFEKFKEIAKELFRVTTNGGVVVWVVGDATIKGSETGTSFRQALWFKECGFNLHDTMIWVKDGGGAIGSNLCYTQNYEYMFVLSKGKPKATNIIKDKPNKSFGKIKRNSGRRKPNGDRKDENPICVNKFSRRNNWWYIPPVSSSKELSGHPAQYPVRLANDHIISWSNEGDTVLDCFMGSGTTGVACVNTGRNFIGIELDEGYFSVAQERIEKAKPSHKMEV
jgi:site-specific DNA-methyltransferase (adenine-specific)